MAINEFKLSQTTTQVQDLLNLLTANPLSLGYTLVTNGSKGVKFVKSLHSGDSIVTVDGDNAITVNVAALRSSLDIPSTETFEAVANKVTSISSSATDQQYPSAKAVQNALSTIGVTALPEPYSNVEAIINQFKQRAFASDILYVVKVVIDSKIVPCILVQAGNISIDGQYVSLMLLYKNTLRYIHGQVASNNVTVAEGQDNIFDLTAFAKTADVASVYATSAYVDNAATGLQNSIDTQIGQLRTEINMLITGVLEGEY